MVTFFVISLVTNILGPLIPEIAESFHLSLLLVGLLPFSFYLAYGIMSIPAGWFVESRGAKASMVAGLIVSLAGSLAFAIRPAYGVAIGSLLVIGIGFAVLQVVINPLLRSVGGEEHFAFNLVVSQLFFGAGSLISPQIYSSLVQKLSGNARSKGGLLDLLGRLVPAGLPWVSLYWVFGALLIAMLLIVAASRFPKLELTESERTGGIATIRQLLKQRVVLLYAVGIFAYVGCEQGTANWISQFLKTYHGADPRTAGADAVSLFWGLMTVGCVLGLLLLKLVDSRKVLVVFTVAAMASLTVALFGPARVAALSFGLVGFFASVMWSIVFALALNSVEHHHGSFSGILCASIAGGAVVPLIIGAIGNVAGLRSGMTFLYVTFGYVLSIGFWARPIITNKTIRSTPAQVS
jgi:FHS family L-fucose permease-like MFS transporter